MPAFLQNNLLDRWTHALGKPATHGIIKAIPEHFRVTERLKYEPDGSGEHTYLLIEKRNTNTEYVAGSIARLAGMARRDVGYAGMKDRHAVTRQWFSVCATSQPQPDWNRLNSEHISVVEISRHPRKLRRGALTGNRFEIVITGLTNTGEVIQRLEKITDYGVPNYFGEQRFGRHGDNIGRAVEMFSGSKRFKRHQCGIYLSAARSFLFNEVLSQRVEQKSWQRILTGDVLMLSGTHSVFVAEAAELMSLQQRLDNHDLDLTGPLVGGDESMASYTAADLEQGILGQYAELLTGLSRADLSSARRPLRVVPRNFEYDVTENEFTLKFFLQAGSYATAVLREIVNYEAQRNTTEDTEIAEK